MEIKITNSYANNGEKEEKIIDIKDSCRITNYIPNADGDLPSGGQNITIFVNDKNATITKGRTNNVNQADFNEIKYSIFNRLALQDGNDNDLTEEDLKKADTLFKKGCTLFKLGVVDIDYNPDTHQAIVKIKDNQVLFFDFSISQKDKVSKPNKDISQNKANTNTSTCSTNNTSSVSSKSSSQNTVKPPTTKDAVDSVIATFTGGNIDISNVKDLASVARYTGISEEYIKDILVGIEGNKKYPLLKAQYDGVPGKNHPNGYLTLGFGHTELTGAPKPKDGMEISEKQAYQILANDIITAKKYARNALKTKDGRNLFDEAPKSIQNALIDLSFNKGPNSVRDEHLVANLKEGYYGAASRRTWYDTTNTGLQKRNVYRFLESIKDINDKDKPLAMQKFYNDHANELKVVFKKDNDAQVAWNSACNKHNANGCFY